MNLDPQSLQDAGVFVGSFTALTVIFITVVLFVALVLLPLFVWGIYNAARRIEKAQKHIFERQEKLLIDIRTALQRQAR
jgi:hypothetical protein